MATEGAGDPQLLGDPVALRRLLDATDDVITVMGPDGTHRYVSSSLQRVLGYERLEPGLPVEIVHPCDRQKLVAAAEAVEGASDPVTVEFRIRHADGSWRWIEATATDHTADPHIGGVVTVNRDVTLRNEAETELLHRRTMDELTWLPNRTLVTERLEQVLADMAPGSPPVAVIMVDIDRFRTVNEQLGRKVGDAVLRAVGGRLVSAACPECTVGRYGGDEFVLLHTVGPGMSGDELAAHIDAAFAEPVDAEGLPVPLSVTVGCYEREVPGARAQEILAFAVAATHSLKEMKRAR